ncbi:MAG: acyl-CoA dehydrogenase family protein [Alphaproteobacteria bacterium]|nr:acyl-CoA dehydrogenase family protein [Alphaproteobacteria bacterium]
MAAALSQTEMDGAAADYLALVRALAPDLRAQARDIDERCELPAHIIDKLVDQGFFRLLLPRSLGGAELLPADYVPIIEAFAELDGSLAWCLNQNSGCSMTAAYLSEEVAREIFGPPDGILAWGPGPGEARAVAGGYNVTAKWAFASGSHHASWLGCHVPVIEQNGQPRLHSDGTPAVRTLFFPKSKTTFTDIWHTLGLRGTGSDQYEVKDLFVPEAYSLPSIARNSPDKRREPGLLYNFSSLSIYAAGFAGVATGCARATLAAFIELARDKIPRGARVTMRNNHVIQSEVAQAEVRVASAWGHLIRSLEDITAAVKERGHITIDERMAIRLNSTYCIQTAVAVIDILYRAAGATAIFNDNPFERPWRDVHTVAQQIQGRQQHFETVGAYMMGLEPDTSWL